MVFRALTSQVLQCFQAGEPLTWCVLAPSGLEVACCSSEGQLQIWGVEGRVSRRLKAWPLKIDTNRHMI